MKTFYEKQPWQKLYPEWLPTSFEPVKISVLEDFELACQETPDNPAICYFDNVYSYREIRKMALGLSAGLDNLGIGVGDRLIILMQNIPQAVIGLLAAFMRRAVVVPVSPMYTADEITHYVDDSGARLVICQESLYENQVKKALENKDGIKVITTSPLDFIGQENPVPAQLEDERKLSFRDTTDFMTIISENENMQAEVALPNPDDVACLIYTSGTTGPPKGAIISHGNIAHNAHVYQVCCQLDKDDVVLGVAPFFHVTGMVAHIAISFHARIPLVIFHRFDLADMLRLMEKYKVTFVVAAITVYTAMLNYPKLLEYDLSAFNKAYSGGAPVSEAIVKKMKAVLGIYIHNVYGMTETTSPATIVPLRVEGPVDEESGALSVGLVVPGHQARIVDLENLSVDSEPGEEGELALKGPGIVCGYWNKVKETENAIKDGWMFTGDIAKMDPAGWCYIVDRKKDQINTSGFKVWPREVEDILYKHPGVMEAAVVGVPDDYRGETVKAFVALKHDFKTKVLPQELIAFCKDRMAAYKYPRIVEIMDELPKTVTGKYLRRELK